VWKLQNNEAVQQRRSSGLDGCVAAGHGGARGAHARHPYKARIAQLEGIP
jgi:hypothetical protein